MRKDRDNPLALSSKKACQDQTGYGQELERLRAELEAERKLTQRARGQLGAELRRLREKAERQQQRSVRELAARRGCQKDRESSGYLLAKDSKHHTKGDSTWGKTFSFCSRQTYTKLEKLLLTLYEKINGEKVHHRQEIELEKAIFLCHLLEAHGRLLQGTKRAGPPSSVFKSSLRKSKQEGSINSCPPTPPLSSSKPQSAFPSPQRKRSFPNAGVGGQASQSAESSGSDEPAPSKCMTANMESSAPETEEKVRRLRRKNTELAVLAKRLEDRARKLQEANLKVVNSPSLLRPGSVEQYKRAFARQRARDLAQHADVLLSKDKEIAALQQECRELEERLGTSKASSLPSGRVEFEKLLRESQKEVLRLQRQLSVSSCRGQHVQSSDQDRTVEEEEEEEKVMSSLSLSTVVCPEAVSAPSPCCSQVDTASEVEELDIDVAPAPYTASRGAAKLQVFIARYSYNPYDGPNDNPEVELPLTAGEYIYVYGDMDDDGFYEGELMDGRRGLVPSNFVEPPSDPASALAVPAPLTNGLDLDLEEVGLDIVYNVYVDQELRLNVPFGSQTKAVLERLDINLKAYRVSVQSLTEKGLSDQLRCSMLVGRDVCVAPTQLRVERVTATSANLTWLPSNSNYVHIVSLNEEECELVKAGCYSLCLNNLLPSLQYTVKVEARPHRTPWELPVERREHRSTTISFSTLMAGPPDAPLDVQLEHGPSPGIALISWLPVTIDAAGTSNGVRVTGYTIYADKKKVLEVSSPTAGSALLGPSQMQVLGEAQELTVRTTSAHGESCNSLPVNVPSKLAEIMAGPATPVPVVPPLSCSPVCPISQLSPVAAPQPPPVAAPAPEPAVAVAPVVDLRRDTDSPGTIRPFPSITEFIEDPSAKLGTPERIPTPPKAAMIDLLNPPDINLHRPPSTSPLDSEAEEEQESSRLVSIEEFLRQDQEPVYCLRQPVSSGLSCFQDFSVFKSNVRIFVALFPYDPASMSPNPDAAEEELPFSEGQIIKVCGRSAQTALIHDFTRTTSLQDPCPQPCFPPRCQTSPPSVQVYGDKDADGFYRGESAGRLGYVPCNMVSEIQVEDEETRQQLLQQGFLSTVASMEKIGM
uniref:TSPO associated protein 1 n=1 Tax=Salarias fasciatus TaxID=181472 RepID=A0A672G3S3_SALFA